MNIDNILKRALKHAERRELLGKNAINCPKCDTNQVQLIDHFVSPAEWKCRHCKTKFNFEPED